MRTLVLDVGNTAVKAGFFDETGRLVRVCRAAAPEELLADVRAFAPQRTLVASVDAPAAAVAHTLELPETATVVLAPNTPLPIRMGYATPLTLGADRLAAAVGAAALLPGQDCVVVDAGTCLKVDLTDAAGTFWGGTISPGLRMRFEALPTFTGRLPLVEPGEGSEEPGLPGDSTLHSIRAGVELGYVAEVVALMEAYRQRHPALRVVLTGGDSRWLAARLPATTRIFARLPDLVLLGLHRILLHTTVC